MLHGRYIAEDDPELYGKTALIMPTDNPRMIQAQFDDRRLHEDVEVPWFYLPLASFEMDNLMTLDIEVSPNWGATINSAWASIS